MKSSLVLLVMFFCLCWNAELALAQPITHQINTVDAIDRIPVHENQSTEFETSKIKENDLTDSTKTEKLFNTGDMLIQSGSGFLVSGLLGIGAAAIAAGNFQDNFGVTPILAFSLTASLTTPFIVYFIGDQLTDKEKIETSFSSTLLFYTPLNVIGIGPVGAAFGYQLSKKYKLENHDTSEMKEGK